MTRDARPSRKGPTADGSLFDASAIINLLISRGNRIIDLLTGNWILDLTVYEVGNEIWKMNKIHRKISSSEADTLLESLLSIAADRMKLVPSAAIDHLSSLGLAREERLSFCDASYLSAAIERELVLVTDDRRLFEAAGKHVKVRASTEI